MAAPRLREWRDGMESYTLKSPHSVRVSVPTTSIAGPRPLSVCHVVSAEMWAGAEAQIATLLLELKAAGDVSLSAVVLGEGRLAEKLRAAGIELLCVPNAGGRFLHCYRQARAFLAGRNVDIIHSHKSKENVLAWMLARSLKIPHLLRTQHGRPEPRTLKDRAVYRLEAITAARVDRYISVSAELAAFLQGRVAADRIEILRNTIDLRQVASKLSVGQAKRRLGIEAGAQVIGIAARLAPVKRLDIFLSVAQEVLRERPQTVFVIAGEGPEEPKLRAAACDKGLDTAVRFLGQRDDIYNVLRAYDVLLVTSDNEGLPTVVLEAMALGAPVVARAVGGIPEIIKHGVNGMLVGSASAADLAAACSALLASPSARERMAQKARETAELYAPRQNADAVLRLYSEMVFGRQ
jgi:glycosyltransferase involved in cell wall biosynthesis